MSDAQKDRLFDEAAEIFVRLNDAPDDDAAQKAHAAFIARGPEARDAYRKVSKVWAASGRRRTPHTGILMIAVMLVGLAGAYFRGEIAVAISADLSTGHQMAERLLASGDRVALDASSALIDDTDDGIRRARLLAGAALFDVAEDGRPFVVRVGDLSVAVIGTAFEVSHIDGGASVAVVEGAVEVTIDTHVWRLGPGDTLRYTQDQGVSLGALPESQIAAWRSDRMITDGVLLGDVLAMIDRRLPGDILMLEGALGTLRVTGGFDLDDPAGALDAVAAGLGLKVVSLRPFGTVILSRQ